MIKGRLTAKNGLHHEQTGIPLNTRRRMQEEYYLFQIEIFTYRIFRLAGISSYFSILVVHFHKYLYFCKQIFIRWYAE